MDDLNQETKEEEGNFWSAFKPMKSQVKTRTKEIAAIAEEAVMQ